MKRLAVFAATALVLAAPSLAAAAPQVRITGYGFPLGSNTAVLHYAGSPFDGRAVYAGQFRLTGTVLGTSTPVAFATFCVDILDPLSLPGVFELKSLGKLFTGAKAEAINKLLTNVTPTDATQSAALQLALWEVTFDGTPRSVKAGSLQGSFWTSGGNSAAARTLADNYLANLAGWSASTTQRAALLYAPDNQSQVILTAVPEPASWGLMIVGFGAVGAALRLRRRGVVAA